MKRIITFISLFTLLIVAFCFLSYPTFGTVTSTMTSTSPMTGSGTTGPFSFSFPATGSNALEVLQTNSSGVTTTLVGWTSKPVNNDYMNGGSVTLANVCPVGSTITIMRSTPVTQETSFTLGMPALYKTFERGLDKLTEIAQENRAQTITLSGILSGSGVTDIVVSATTGYYMPADSDIDNWDAGYEYRLVSASGAVPLNLSLAGNVLTGSIDQASTSTNGYLTSVDWNIFNGKLSSGTTAFDSYRLGGQLPGYYAASSHTQAISTISDSTTVGQNFVKLTNPSAIRFARINADNTVTALSDSDFRTAIGVGSGGGTVLSVSGTSPIVSSGGNTPVISIATFGASGTNHASGAVPDPGAVEGSIKYLREDGTFAIPAGSGTTITVIQGTAPVVSSGVTTVTISMAASTNSVNGYLTSTDYTTFNTKQTALNGTGFVKASGTTITYDNSTYLSSGGDLGTPSAGTLTNCTFPTLNQSTTGSAKYLKDVTTTGKISISGVTTGATRAKIISDANDTFVEVGGIHAASEKTTPIDTDELPLIDSAASNVLKKITGTDLKAYLKSYFDTLYTGSGVTSYSAGNYMLAETDWDNPATSAASNYAKLFEFLIPYGGTVTVRIGILGSGFTSYAKVYIDGSAVGAEVNRSNTGWQYWNQNTTVTAGCLLQLYTKHGTTGIGTYWMAIGTDASSITIPARALNYTHF